MTGSLSPTVRRRELGSLLRELRKDLDLTIEDVSERLLCSPAKISRIETGHRNISLRDVRDLCDVYGVEDQTQRQHLMSLAKESKERAWWQEYDLPYSNYIGLEAAAISISDYESGSIPGLLQTQDYARALIRGMQPKMDIDAVDQQVAARLTRQEILTRENPPAFRAVLDEAALHRRVGTPEIMRNQLQRLIDMGQMPNVAIQIIPFNVGAHPGIDSTFIILEFSEPAVSSVVYVEGLVGNIYLERATDLERYTDVFDQLSTIALTVDESPSLIEEVRDGSTAKAV